MSVGEDLAKVNEDLPEAFRAGFKVSGGAGEHEASGLWGVVRGLGGRGVERGSGRRGGMSVEGGGSAGGYTTDEPHPQPQAGILP
jgi:hypothetical protein